MASESGSLRTRSLANVLLTQRRQYRCRRRPRSCWKFRLDHGNFVPTLDCTRLTSVLLITPSTVTSSRNVELVTLCPTFDWVRVTSLGEPLDVTDPLLVVSPRSTPMATLTSLVCVPSLTLERVTKMV